LIVATERKAEIAAACGTRAGGRNVLIRTQRDFVQKPVRRLLAASAATLKQKNFPIRSVLQLFAIFDATRITSTYPPKHHSLNRLILRHVPPMWNICVASSDGAFPRLPQGRDQTVPVTPSPRGCPRHPVPLAFVLPVFFRNSIDDIPGRPFGGCLIKGRMV